MSTYRESRSSLHHLRVRAEHALALRYPVPPEEGLEPVLRELQVHQLELEMQNEALRDAQRQGSALRAKYEDLFEFAPLPYLVLDAHSRVFDCNRAAREFLALTPSCNQRSQKLSTFIEPRFAERLHLHIRATLASDRPEHCDIGFLAGEGVRSFRLQSSRVHNQPVLWRTMLIERFDHVGF